jgi:hypothetical protein
MEAVDAGVARLVTTDPARIVAGVERLLDVPTEYEAMSRGANPVGDGQASKRIVNDLLNAGGMRQGADLAPELATVDPSSEAAMAMRMATPISQPTL